MKARIKVTGEIVNVYNWGEPTFRADDGNFYQKGALDFDVEDENNPNYWTRLEHQAAIAAMQGILNNHNLYGSVIQMTQVSSVAIDYAQELVQKLKEKEERK